MWKSVAFPLAIDKKTLYTLYTETCQFYATSFYMVTDISLNWSNIKTS